MFIGNRNRPYPARNRFACYILEFYLRGLFKIRDCYELTSFIKKKKKHHSGKQCEGYICIEWIGREGLVRVLLKEAR